MLVNFNFDALLKLFDAIFEAFAKLFAKLGFDYKIEEN